MSGEFLAEHHVPMEFVNSEVAKADDHSITFVLTDLLGDDKQYFFIDDNDDMCSSLLIYH